MSHAGRHLVQDANCILSYTLAGSVVVNRGILGSLESLCKWIQKGLEEDGQS